MRGLLWLALWLQLLVSVTSATPPNEQCVTAVYTAYGYIGFAGFPAKGFWNTRCQNALEVTSIYAACEVYCSPAERTAGLVGLAAYCREYAGVDLIPREQLAENLTEDAIHRMRIVEYRELPKKGAVDDPVLISEAFYQVTFRTLDAWQFETWSHYAYGYAGYAFWAGIIAIGTLHRVVYHFIGTRRSQWGTSVHPRSHSIWSPFKKLYTSFQTHLLVPSPIPSRGRQFLCWTFSTRVEALIVLLFWVLSTVFCAIGYRVFSGNLYWPDTSAQLLRYVADRTGILSFANFPLIWLFSGRNNIFLWATGWSFATFNLFHRHVAWIATIQGVVHTVLYLVMFIQNGNAWRKMQKPYLFWGTVGMVAMILLLPLAMDFFRHRSYECFLVLHILLSVATLVGCFYHSIIFEGQEYWVYLWPAVGLWALDRGLRLVRIMYCNLHVHLNLGQGIKFTKSTATYDKSADVIRLEVFPASKYIRPTPGQYYFLYQPFRLTGWECHPFTLGSWTYEDPTLSPESADFKDDHNFDVSQVPLLSDSSSNASRSRERLSQFSQQQLKLVFWIRPFDGWTKSLRQQCMRSSNRSTQTTLLLEGPYGEHFPLSNYESVLLVVGGTGIAAAIPYIQDHLMQSAEKSESVKPLTRDIHLVWTTRQEAFIRDVVARDLQDALGRGDFNVSFYVTTRSKHQAQPDQDLFHEPTAISQGQNLDILQGRPDLRSIISLHAQEAQLADCSAAVMVCGPPAMADEARSAVHATMLQGYDRIRYIEESFSW